MRPLRLTLVTGWLTGFHSRCVQFLSVFIPERERESKKELTLDTGLGRIHALFREESAEFGSYMSVWGVCVLQRYQRLFPSAKPTVDMSEFVAYMKANNLK